MKDALELFASRFAPPSLKEGGAVAISSLTGAADAFLALALTKGSRLVLAATPGLPDADRLADDLHTLSATIPSARNIRVLEFPPPLAGDVGALGTRLKTLAAIRAWPLSPYPCVLVVSSPALASPVPTGAPPVISLGTDPEKLGSDPIKFGEICEKLATFGYNRVPMVEQVGDFSVRGGIVDAWSPGEEFPIRAEFFGDDLESIRTFDAATQMSIERVEKAALLPAGGKDEEPGKQCSLLDLLPDGSAVLALEHNDYSLPVPPPSRSLTFVYTGDPAPRGVPTGKFQTTPLPGFAELGADEAHHPELFDAARGRLERHLAAAKKRGDLVLAIDDLSGGFELSAPAAKDGADGRSLLVVAKSDRVFAKRKTHLRNAALARGARLNDFDELEPGEYVVHVDYGVGRFVGSSEILVNGKRSEVFTIEYADGAKLHVPAAHAHLLSRYVGVKGEAVRLHRLDGKRWAKDKADAQKAVTDLAAALLETQARRELVPGFAYDVECDGIDAFEAAFPYEETPD